MSKPRTARPGIGGPDIDDGTRCIGIDVTTGKFPGAEVRAVKCDVDDSAPRVCRHVFGRNGKVGSSVVDENVGKAKL